MLFLLVVHMYSAPRTLKESDMETGPTGAGSEWGKAELVEMRQARRG